MMWLEVAYIPLQSQLVLHDTSICTYLAATSDDRSRCISLVFSPRPASILSPATSPSTCNLSDTSCYYEHLQLATCKPTRGIQSNQSIVSLMDKSKARRHGVGGRLRQRLSQILLHSSCTTTSATAFVSLAKTNVAVAGNAAGARQAPPPAGAGEVRPKIDGSVRRRRRRSARALVHISIDCSGATSARHSARSVGAAVVPSPVAPAKDMKAVIRSKARGGKPRSPSYSCSSSTVTDDELPPFSSSDGDGGEGAETRSSTLFSSLSISSDSTSDFYNSTGGGGSKRHHKNPPRRVPRRALPRGANAADAKAAPKPHEDNKGGAKKADDKHGGGGVGVAAAGSMAVVKRSHNPYADFRSSMVEMVVERRICGADAMGDLLVSYLSLNSRRHHPAILAAFEDVWEAVFGTP